MVVASPVQDYFLLLDGLPEPRRSAAMETARPLLDALGENYDAHCDGTAFYALQSCANHSCKPNAHTIKVRFSLLKRQHRCTEDVPAGLRAQQLLA